MVLVLALLALIAPAPAVASDKHRHVPGCNTYRCDKRVKAQAEHKRFERWQKIVRPYNAWLNRTAWCESRGRWHINTGNGYYGGLQFALRSWFAVGGRGYPHWASILEQKYRAVKLLHIQGRGAWPVCG
jgi:Transglycosylase-like domain